MADLINITTKQDAVDPYNPQSNEQVTAAEFNEVVTKTNAAITELNTVTPGDVTKLVSATINLVADTNYDITVGNYGDNAQPWNVQVWNSAGQLITDNIYSPQRFNDGVYKIRIKSSTDMSNVVVSWITIS